MISLKHQSYIKNRCPYSQHIINVLPVDRFQQFCCSMPKHYVGASLRRDPAYVIIIYANVLERSATTTLTSLRLLEMIIHENHLYIKHITLQQFNKHYGSEVGRSETRWFLQYIPRNMHTVLLCFALLWLCNLS